MLNQGRPLLRVERSGARKGKGDSREWTAPGPGFRGGVVAYAFFVDGCSTRPGRGFIARMASEQSEHRWVWVGGEPVRRAGIRIMSGGNSERTTTCFASRVS